MANQHANPGSSWAEQNQIYLSAEFARLRHLLAPDEQADAATAAELDKRVEELRSAMTAPPAIDGLSELFGLSGFERSLVMLCAGVGDGLAAGRRLRAGAGPSSAERT